MARTFDTGLHVPQRTALRNAIVAKLAPLKKSNGLYLRAIGKLAAPYLGAGDDDGLALLHLTLQGQAPAIVVALGDAKWKSIGMDALDLQGVIAVHVYVATVNPRGPVDGRLEPDVTATADDTADPGIDTMLEDVLQQLVGQDPGVDGLYEPHVLEERAVFTGPEMTIWEVVLAVRADRWIDPDRAVTQQVDEIKHTTYDDSGTDPETDPGDVIVETETDLEEP